LHATAHRLTQEKRGHLDERRDEQRKRAEDVEKNREEGIEEAEADREEERGACAREGGG
jgi:hypothetical protein